MTGNDLRAWRTTYHYTQEGLAYTLGVSHATVVLWEMGNTRIPAYLWRVLRDLEREGEK